MISQQYKKLFDEFKKLGVADTQYKNSLTNLHELKQALKEIKKIGKISSKVTNSLLDEVKLNYQQISSELNELRKAVLSDKIFDKSEVQTFIDKFYDIFEINQNVSYLNDILSKENIITDTFSLKLDKKTPSFSNLFKKQLNDILNANKSVKGINQDLSNFKNNLDKYTDINQTVYDELKSKNKININKLFSDKNYISYVLSDKKIENVENFLQYLNSEIDIFNNNLNSLLKRYEIHIEASANQINQSIIESLNSGVFDQKSILNEIENILNLNKKKFDDEQDKQESEEERLRLEKEAEEERLKREEEEERLKREEEAEKLRLEEEKKLIAKQNAEKIAEQARIDEEKRKQRQKKFLTFIGYLALIALAALCIWGLWELCVYVWFNYTNAVVISVTAILAITSAIFYFADLKFLGICFFIGTGFVYYFLDDLVTSTVEKNNQSITTEDADLLIKLLIDKKKQLDKTSKIKRCPSSGYKNNCKGNVTYSNGNVYEGFFKNDKRHGQGTFIYKSGTKLSGSFYEGLPSFGTETYVGKWKGDKYTGSFSKWKRSGRGTYYWKNGDKYIGQWKDGKRLGQGTYIWKNGDKYVGQYKDGKKHGQGTKTYKNGKTEKGIWKNDKFIGLTSVKSSSKNQIKAKENFKSNKTNKCPSSGYKNNCKGKATFSNGDVYEGFYKNSKRDGQGTYSWKDGRKYIGQWKNDKQNGQGTFFWSRGKYVGQWKDGKRNGQGTMTYKSGKIEKGIWKNNKFQYASGSQNP